MLSAVLGLFSFFLSSILMLMALERLPASRDVSTYASRTFRLPFSGLVIDAGVRLENIFGRVTPLDVERKGEERGSVVRQRVKLGAGHGRLALNLTGCDEAAPRFADPAGPQVRAVQQAATGAAHREP